MGHQEVQPDRLRPGLYDRLISDELAAHLAALADPRLWELLPVEAGDSHAALAQYVEHVLAGALGRFRGEDSADRQRRIVNRLLATLREELGAESVDNAGLADPLRRLLVVHPPSEGRLAARPDTPLSRSALLTGTKLDPSLASQLRKEIATADRVDVLCSFIRWSGLRLIISELKDLTSRAPARAPRLRVITTSYMGATDPRAVEALAELPNTKVRVSYDTARTRLHAKAYLIHRDTGFGCAYVGSANLSHAALSEGLEWTSKISQYELPHLWQRLVATFEGYWTSDEFDAFTESSRPRLRSAIARERESPQGESDSGPFFDLHPWPFQQEILDVLAAEREVQGKKSHLVVAATGTGKTMIAAFDYRAWAGTRTQRPPLLFVAHREEILRQALGTFRAVLRDHNFGELLVGGHQPENQDHLFCSIQSYHSRELWRLPPDRHEYVVVDEFHHAAAPSYVRLLDHLRPRVLLGLTATPERSDALDVYRWFGGEASAQIRLPDAINRRLLCPFHYFGVSDCVDLDGLRWQRGGYRIEDLDDAYTGNDGRAGLVLNKVREYVLDSTRARMLGFCVSKAHAAFMARFFAERGIPACALTDESPDDERRQVRDRLRRRDVNIIFVVDLYNEGVDIPEVDTVLFLRPTESITVYLQQLGRGLRLHSDKECLTVLDFIGAQHREFRFAPRFRALSAEPGKRLDREIEAGFPHLPPGCSMRLERVAQQTILRHVRDTLALRRPRVVEDIRQLAALLGRPPTLTEALDTLDATLMDLLKRGLWSRLLCDAGQSAPFAEPDEERLADGVRRMAHMDDPQLLRFLLAYLQSARNVGDLDELDQRRLSLLHVSLWGVDGKGWSLAQAEAKLRQNPTALRDLCTVLGSLLAHTRTRTHEVLPDLAGPLAIHASYTRDEALVGLGHWTLTSRPDFREGVLHLPGPRADAFFVTLNKTLEDYSTTTMYEDYAISESLFHWQSQSITSADSATGQRYIRHREQGYTPLLFVRENKQLVPGFAAPYSFLGPAEYVSHEGSRPISVVWRLRYPMPARLLRTTARQLVV